MDEREKGGLNEREGLNGRENQKLKKKKIEKWQEERDKESKNQYNMFTILL